MEATLLFSFLLPSHLGSTLKEKNLLPEEYFFFCTSRSCFERAALAGKANKKSQKLFPFENQVGILIADPVESLPLKEYIYMDVYFKCTYQCHLVCFTLIKIILKLYLQKEFLKAVTQGVVNSTHKGNQYQPNRLTNPHPVRPDIDIEDSYTSGHFI